MAEPFVGEIRLFPFGIVPRGWAQCNGQTLTINGNTALYSLIGFTYGGDGKTTFAVPDLRGRAPIQPANGMPGAATGEETHSLTINEMPPHNHALSATALAASTNVAAGGVWALAPSSAYTVTGPTRVPLRSDTVAANNGTGAGHQNMQPYLVGNYCIALIGYYPTRP